MNKKIVVIGIGGLAVSNNINEIITTYALGSCVAVSLYHSKLHLAGLVHIALPESSINKERSLELPGYYVDSGLELLFQQFYQLNRNMNKNDIIIKLAGGAKTFHKSINYFKLGERNVEAVKQFLKEKGYKIFSEETGGELSRNVSIDVETGDVLVTNLKKGTWKI